MLIYSQEFLGEMDAENVSGSKIKVLEITDNKAKLNFITEIMLTKCMLRQLHYMDLRK